ncbi:hypothetical protein MR478_00055, partial [bacterium]|nr:hypothetical protein [bacterium]
SYSLSPLPVTFILQFYKIEQGSIQRVGFPDTLQKGDPSGTASPDRPVPPFENPLDKILREIAHSSLCSSHTISRKISLSVSPSSAQVRRW